MSVWIGGFIEQRLYGVLAVWSGNCMDWYQYGVVSVRSGGCMVWYVHGLLFNHATFIDRLSWDFALISPNQLKNGYLYIKAFFLIAAPSLLTTFCYEENYFKL